MKKIILYISFFLYCFAFENIFCSGSPACSSIQINLQSSNEIMKLIRLALQYLNNDSSETFEKCAHFLSEQLYNNATTQRDSLIKNEKEFHDQLQKNAHDIDLQANRVCSVIEVLFLLSNTTQDIELNKELFKKIVMKYHPDKLKDQCTEHHRIIFNEIDDLLNKKKPCSHLNSFVNDISHKLHEHLGEINQEQVSLSGLPKNIFINQPLGSTSYVIAGRTVNRLLFSPRVSDASVKNVGFNLLHMTQKLESLKVNLQLSSNKIALKTL